MTSVQTKSTMKTFSIILQLASLILLIVYAYCIVTLFRDLRRLEALVEKKNGPGQMEKTDSIPKRPAVDERSRVSRGADRAYETGPSHDHDGLNERLARGYQATTDSFDSSLKFGGNKVTIVTKDDERLLLQTADGSPWALLPSLTRISLSTLEDFCFTAHQYCANKNQVLRPISDQLGGTQGTDCDGRCSSRRSNNEKPRDLDVNPSSPADLSQQPQVDEYGPRTVNEFGYSGSYTGADNDVDSVPVSTTPLLAPPPAKTSPIKRRKGLGRKKRKRERCYIEKISVPFQMGHHQTFYGSWMQDASPREDFDADKRWLTQHISGQFLFEYGSSFDLKRGGTHGDTPVKTYQLPHMFDGTNHLMYNGSFLYQRAHWPVIVRFDLRTENWTETRIPGAACKGDDYLYSGISYNYFDLAADENGIWVFFHYEKSKTLSVARLHPKTMRIIRTWNLTRFDHTQIGDTWVACGVMYVLDSRTATNTFVSVAYDLFRHRSANVTIPWRNSYNNTSMLSYNPFVKRLYIFDNGYLLENNLLLAYPGKAGVS